MSTSFNKGIYAMITLKLTDNDDAQHYFVDSGSVYDFLIDHCTHVEATGAEGWTELACVGEVCENEFFKIEMVQRS